METTSMKTINDEKLIEIMHSINEKSNICYSELEQLFKQAKEENLFQVRGIGLLIDILEEKQQLLKYRNCFKMIKTEELLEAYKKKYPESYQETIISRYTSFEDLINEINKIVEDNEGLLKDLMYRIRRKNIHFYCSKSVPDIYREGWTGNKVFEII